MTNGVIFYHSSGATEVGAAGRRKTFRRRTLPLGKQALDDLSGPYVLTSHAIEGQEVNAAGLPSLPPVTIPNKTAKSPVHHLSCRCRQRDTHTLRRIDQPLTLTLRRWVPILRSLGPVGLKPFVPDAQPHVTTAKS